MVGADVPPPTVTTLPVPSGGVAHDEVAAVRGLGCAGPNTCVVVGNFKTTGGFVPFAADETDGSPFTAQAIDPPTGATNISKPVVATTLLAVACPAPGDCTAVGAFTKASGDWPWAVQEVDGVWSTAQAITPPTGYATGTQAAELNAVACNGLRHCEAVGTYTATGVGQLPFAVSEVDGVWSTAVVPALPTGALTSEQDAGLFGLSCPTSGNCAAVGTFANATDQQAMVLHQTGGTWAPASGGTTVTLPDDAATTGDDQNALLGIDCPSLLTCVAVGQYETADAIAPMALNEDDGSWPTATTLTTPTPTETTGTPVAFLTSVSCAPPGSCEAVGDYGTTTGLDPLTVSLAAGNWGSGTTGSLPTSPAPNGTVATNAAADCFAATTCLIVGFYDVGTQQLPFASVPYTVPGAPTDFTATVGHGKVTLQWSAPAYDGRTAITGYDVAATPGDSTCATTTLSCTVTDLTVGVRYCFTVTATNAVGVSSPSIPVCATPAQRPSAPRITSVAALRGGFQLVVAPPNDTGGAPVLTYEYSLNGGVKWRDRSTGTTSRILLITGLRRHHTYELSVRAVNVIGPGAPSPVRAATTS